MISSIYIVTSCLVRAFDALMLRLLLSRNNVESKQFVFLNLLNYLYEEHVSV